MKRLSVAVVVTFLGLSAGVANAKTALFVGGAGGYAQLTEEQMTTAFNGYFADPNYTSRVSVTFPGDPDDYGTSLEIGKENLLAAIRETDGPMTIGAVSESAGVIPEVLRVLADDPSAPPPDQLDAFIYGGVGIQRIWWGKTVKGWTYRKPPETPYNVTVVFAEYDGIAELPENRLNLLAVTNALMGADQLHVDAAFSPAADLSTIPADYIWVEYNREGGTTTTYVIPTAELPILEPLREKGVDPATIARLDRVLRPIIDSAYARTYRRHVIGKPPSSTLASNESSGLEATALKLNSDPVLSSGSTPADQGVVEAGSDAVTQTQRGLSTLANGAAAATDRLGQRQVRAPGKADPFGTARNAATTQRRTGATNLTDGNKVKPGQGLLANLADNVTGVLQRAPRLAATQASPTANGPTGAAGQVENAGPNTSGASTAPTANGGE